MQSSKSRQGLGTFLIGTTILLLLLVLTLALFHSTLSSSRQGVQASIHLQLPIAAITVSPTSSTSSSSPAKVAAAVAAETSAAVATKSSVPGLSCQGSGWYAELGAFYSSTQAEKLAHQAGSAGHPVCIAKHPDKRLYRVLAGPPATDRATARALAEHFSQIEISPHAYPQYWSPTP